MSLTSRRIVAGFLAGASSVIGLMAILMLLIVSFGIVSLMRDVAMQTHGPISFSQALPEAISQTLLALIPYLWSARWAVLLLGGFGIVLAIVDDQRSRIRRPWRDQLGFIVTLGTAGAVVISFEYAGKEVTQSWVADQPVLFSQQDLLFNSDSVSLLLGLMGALAIAYVVWVAWQWWFEHWRAWLRLPHLTDTPVDSANATAQPRDDYDWQAYQARIFRLKQTAADEVPAATDMAADKPEPRSWVRFLLIALASTTVIAYLLLRLYNTVGPVALSGELWVNATAPQTAASLPLQRTPKRITVSNTGGAGTVEIRVTTGPTTPVLRKVDRMQLAGGADRYEISNLDLSGLAPGDYELDLILHEGTGGLLRYVALYGGGLVGQLAALSFGVAAGLWLALATIVMLEVIMRGRRIPATSGG